ncbi:hypothetical protein KIW84_022503 [Lathyrus oleraceus]|uniref:Uncharacterized protein n=1 Tax=Pisum sativum TaxID=3888 RepID=A0A9D4YBC8_PEA|nr:hypothetical protein KIW84_022503 [Pisum sativum]
MVGPPFLLPELEEIIESSNTLSSPLSGVALETTLVQLKTTSMVDWSQEESSSHLFFDCSFVFLRARNVSTFEDKKVHWKSCITIISAQAKFMGNITTKPSDSSISNFTFLKMFDISIHPCKPLLTKEDFWSPLPLGWIKCNIDGLPRGSPTLSSCGGIFRDDKACHVGSFCAFIDISMVESAELTTSLFSIEKAREFNWRKVWKLIVCLLLKPSPILTLFLGKSSLVSLIVCRTLSPLIS